MAINNNMLLVVLVFILGIYQIRLIEAKRIPNPDVSSSSSSPSSSSPSSDSSDSSPGYPKRRFPKRRLLKRDRSSSSSSSSLSSSSPSSDSPDSSPGYPKRRFPKRRLKKRDRSSSSSSSSGSSSSSSDDSSKRRLIDPIAIDMEGDVLSNKDYCVRVWSESPRRYLYLGLNRKLDRNCATKWRFNGLSGGSPGHQNFALSTGRRPNNIYLSALPDRLSNNIQENPERFILERAPRTRDHEYNFINSYNDDEFNKWSILCQKNQRLVYKATNNGERNGKTCQWQFTYN